MLKRIVKLTFRDDDTVDIFLNGVFEPSKAAIRAFPGCHSMELLRDAQNPLIFFTFSVWDDAAALERYRLSELFQNTWAKTKVLFGDKPQAWSTAVVDAG
jgi:quinol monooxygenase YgiN